LISTSSPHPESTSFYLVRARRRRKRLRRGSAEAQLADRALAVLEAAYLRIGTALDTCPADVITVVSYTAFQKMLNS
jgi:hypothetical protein